MEPEHNTANILNTYYSLINEYSATTSPCQMYASVDNIFTAEECDSIVAYANSRNMFVKQKTGKDIHVPAEFDMNIDYLMPSPETNYFYNRLRELIMEVNQCYWRFLLRDFGEPLKICKFLPTDQTSTCLHSDVGTHITNFRKLTVSVQLSDADDYTGGDLSLHVSHIPLKMPRKKGTVCIFPSYILHQVSQVQSGQRYSLIGFAYGPPIM